MDIGKIISDVEIVRTDELETSDAPTQPAPADSDQPARTR